MQLKVFRVLWGVKNIDPGALAAFKSAGYDGVEFKSLDARKYSSFGNWCKELQLDFIAQIHTAGTGVDEHLHSFEYLIDTAMPLDPIMINSQSGCDHWSMSDKHRFIETALRIEENQGIPIAHETHRSRMTYTPWDTAALIDSFPEMHIGCDFSHWVNVCERLLLTEQEHLEKATGAAIHLHARVGYEQGPQAPDPRAPEYATHLAAHEQWWQAIWKTQAAVGKTFSTVCPEYGPPMYAHTLPSTGQPVVNVPEITDWAMDRLRSQFQKTFSSTTENKPA
jgi:sugar phosphate isomerase/epimerase